MFTKNLGLVAPMCTADGDAMFPNIDGDRFNGDSSFVATIRALLSRRVPDGEAIRLCIRTVRVSNELLENPPVVVMTGVTGGWDKNTPGTLNLVSVLCNDSDIDALLGVYDNPDSGFVKSFGGISLDRQAACFASNFKCRIYVNPAEKSSVVLVQNMDVRIYHLLQCLTMRLFPWYTEDKEKFPITEKEINLIKSLNQRYATAYEAAIAAIAQEFDFRGASIKRLVGDFESNARRHQIDDIRDDISRLRHDIDENIERYTRMCNELDTKNLMLAGLRLGIEEDGTSSELVDFMVHNKSVTPVSVDGSILGIVVKTFLDFFDVEFYNSARRSGQIFRFESGRIEELNNAENRKKIMDAIFSEEPKLRVKICGYYSLDMRGIARTMIGYDYPEFCNDAIPNTHLQRHSCLGNHKPRIEQHLRDGDLIGAIHQCITSAKSLNLAEWSPTASYFLRDLFSSREKVLQTADGSKDLTPMEALEWLKEQEAAQ